MKDKSFFYNLVENQNGDFRLKSLGVDRIKLGDDEDYDCNANIQDAVLNKTFLKSLNDKYTLTSNVMIKIPKYDEYKQYPASGKSESFKSFKSELPERVANNESTFLDENDSIDSQAEGVEIIMPSNNIDTWAKLEVLLGVKISGHTHTLTEGSNLIDEIYKKDETTDQTTISKICR